MHDGRGTAPIHAANLVAVLLVEEDAFTRRAVSALLRHQGAAGVLEVGCAGEAVDILRSRRISLVVSDCTLPDMAHSTFAAAVRDLNPHASLVVLTGETDAALLYAASTTNGVTGVLSKYGEPELLGPRVLLAGRGGLVLDEIVRRVLADGRSAERHQWAALSQRETQVLTLVREGLSMYAIARKLGLAESTVKTHASRAAVRLGVATSRDAAKMAARMGLLDAPEGDGEVIDLRPNQVGHTR